MGLDLENKGNFGEFENGKNFGSPREVNQFDLTVSNLAEYISDAEVMREFSSYARKTGTGEKTLKGYVTSLQRLQPISCPNDLSDYLDLYGVNITEPQRKALGKFWGFLQIRKGKTSINGYPIALYIANLKIAEKGASRMANRRKDITSEEIASARARLPEAVQVYFSLLAYSGARHSQLFKALSTPRDIERVGNAIRIDVHDLSAGTKNAAYFYFPAEIEPALRAYKHPYAIDKLQKSIGRSGEEGKAVNVANLRKWQYNMLLTGEGAITEIAADHIQGRSPKTVGAAHYANLDVLALEGYNSLVPKLLEALPVPEWMTKGDIPKVKRPPSGSRKGCNETPAKRREKIISLYKSGMNQAEVCRKMKAGKNTVRRILKEEGLLK